MRTPQGPQSPPAKTRSTPQSRETRFLPILCGVLTCAILLTSPTHSFADTPKALLGSPAQEISLTALGLAPPLKEKGSKSAPRAPKMSRASLKNLKKDLKGLLTQRSVRGSKLSALIIDDTTGEVIFESGADTLLKPASNMKLFTTAAAFSLLGEGYRFKTEVLTTGKIDKKGRLNGDLYLMGAHDFTWSAHFYPSARYPLDQIARRIRSKGIREIKGELKIHGDFVYNGQRFSTLNPAAHRSAAARHFRAALKAQGITFGKSSRSASLRRPAGTKTLLTWHSVPLSVACSPINRISHNEFADSLLRHIGFKKGKGGKNSFKEGGKVVLRWMKSIGIKPKGAAIHDGSGLSYSNKLSARHFTKLIRHMQRVPEGKSWNSTLSVAATWGTLGRRMSAMDTKGRVFGKTGTLNVAIATSGYLINRYDGHRYVFSFLMNDQPSQPAARSSHNQALIRLGKDHCRAGVRPSSPNLVFVGNDGDGSHVSLVWRPVQGAIGYHVWVSKDGKVWKKKPRAYSVDTYHTLSGGEAGKDLFVKVTALNKGGESDASDVYGVRVSKSASKVLIIDGNDRWESEPAVENPLRSGHAFAARASKALSMPHDTASNEAVSEGFVVLGDYEAIIWMLGEETRTTGTLDRSERTALSTYLLGGGKLFISGSELAWDLGSHEDPEEIAFLQDILHVGYASDDAGSYRLIGKESFSKLPQIGFYDPTGMVAKYPDRLRPLKGATPVFKFLGGEGGAAGIQYSGDYKLIFFGFPFESIDGAKHRKMVMKKVMKFLGVR